jgi:hypothetical protein
LFVFWSLAGYELEFLILDDFMYLELNWILKKRKLVCSVLNTMVQCLFFIACPLFAI